MDWHHPRTQKFILVGFVSAALIYLYFFSTFIPFGHVAAAEERQNLEADFQKLSADLSKARQTLENRDEVERQYEILERRWQVASKLLPEEREIADLLRQVTLVGQQSGVKFELFRPKPLVRGQVYIEAPVEVKVSGGYHEVGTFLSEVANLSRIVNVNGLRMVTMEDEKSPDHTVVAHFTATAYTLNTAPPPPPPAQPSDAPAPEGAKHEG